MPNARAKLLAVVAMVGGSCAAVTVVWFVLRLNAAGSMNTNPDPLKRALIDSFSNNP